MTAVNCLALVLEDVKVGASPDWAQKQLRAIGVQYQQRYGALLVVLHEFGNPLHAFDQDQIGGGQIQVRKAKQGEAFTTLDGQDRTLDAHDLVIADEHKAMCLAGVYGGALSGVSEHTTRVVLEAAWFHPVTVRKSAKRHTLSTDASFRFERGVDPNMVRMAASRCVHLLQEWAGARLVGGSEYQGIQTVNNASVELQLTWLFDFLGTQIDPERLKSILASLDIVIVDEAADV